MAETFNLMLDRLETAFNQQSMFVANAAHELRTPLAALRTNLEVVLADSEASLTEYQEMGSQLQFALDRLERLVADLLLLSSAARVDEEIVVLGPLIEQVVDNLTAMAAEKQVSLRLKGDGELEGWGNPLLLERAVYNLVENGIYYNQPQGNVEVTLFREMNKVVIRVADNGIGIPAAEQSLIFDRFYRLDRSRTRHSGGRVWACPWWRILLNFIKAIFN
ncbi:MAG: ATP-binding protein [Chloroflexi bacterium]|nr:ATP-binding protein [Chloroflexota bacterium]